VSTLLVDFHPELTRLGWALIHVLWQGLAVAVALELALLLAGNGRGRLRYFLCGAALAALPVCFGLTYAHLGQEMPAPTVEPAPAMGAMSLNAATAADHDPIVANYIPQAGLEAIPPEPRASFLREGSQLVPYVTWAWLAGVMILGARKAGGLVVLSRLRRQGVAEPDDAMMELFRRACARIGVDPRRMCLRISHLVRVPMTMGWLSPIVLFPAALASGLSTGEIELILAHELAHVRRWDYLVNLLQAVVETLFFYHPLTWWISRRMRQERENCCDDLVAEGPQEKLAYARTLLRLEELRAPGETLAAAATGGVLRRRIERLVSEPASGMAGGITLVLVLLLTLGAGAAASAAKGQNPAVTNAVVAKAASVVVSETKEFVGEVGRLYHAMVYQQTSAAAPKEVSWQFIADMANNVFPVTGGTVALPAGSAWAKNPATVVDPKLLVGAHYLFVQGFKSEADLLANFPNGTYAFNIQQEAPAAAYAAPVAFSGKVAYPPWAPVITNKTWDAGALVLDPASAEITYTNYPGATLTWEIVIPGDHYIMSAGGGGTALGSLNLTGMLSYGQTYVAQLRFINRDKSSTVSEPDAPKDYGYATMMAQIVEFTIKTPAPHASATPAAPTVFASPNVAVSSVVPSRAGPLPWQSPTQQKYISDEMTWLTARLQLSPTQAMALRVAMEAMARGTATRTVDQALKEILSPRQEAAWEEVKKGARLTAAGESAARETERIAGVCALNEAQKKQVFDVLYAIELKHPNWYHSTAEMVMRVDETEPALAKILTPGQALIYEQQAKKDYQNIMAGADASGHPLGVTRLDVGSPPGLNDFTPAPAPLPLNQLPDANLSLAMPKVRASNLAPSGGTYSSGTVLALPAR
jgi:beta-lactamase regulating signal transducer with metallopeptidase domain